MTRVETFRILQTLTHALTHAMPESAISAGNAEAALETINLAMTMDCDSSDEEDFVEQLFLQAVDPLADNLYQEVGPERLSMERLWREFEERGGTTRGSPWDVKNRFGFKLDELQSVIDAFDMPPGFSTRTGHVFRGEEGVLVMLLRFRTADNLTRLTWYTGRNIAAISEGVRWMVEYVNRKFAHLVDDRSFTSWESRFDDFAEAFARSRPGGLPVDSLIGFIDGKLYPVARPTRGQQAVYSGHKRIHGLKVQGIVFPNGIQPYPFMCLGSRHDGYGLRASRILDILRACCQRLGVDYRLFGDSAYPLSRYLLRMHKGNMTLPQQAFNSDMGPERVSVEWGFAAIVGQWPLLDFRKKLQILRAPVGLYLNVGNVLTNMRTCVDGGSEVSRRFGMDPPSLSAYMAGGPF